MEHHGLLIGLSLIGCGLQAHERYSSPCSDCCGGDTVCCCMVVDNDSILHFDSSEAFVTDATGYIINGSDLPLSGGKNTSEILNFIPGVESYGEGYTVNGLPVTEIQINGLAVRGREELEAVPSDCIATIDVDYISGSDKNVNIAGGVIRINLKEPESNPYYGSLQASATFSPYYGAVDGHVGGMMLVKGPQWSFYNMIWLNHDCSNAEEEEEYNYTIYEKEQITRHFYNFSSTRNDALMVKDRFSLVYNVNDNNSITANMYFSNVRTCPETITDGYDDMSYAHTILRKNINENVYLGTLKYVCSLEENNAVFEVSADYMHTDENTKEMMSDFLQKSESSVSLVHDEGKEMWTETLWKKRTDLWSVGTSFSRQIANVGVFKVGASASVVKSVVSPGYGADAIGRTETEGFTPFVYATLTGKWKSVSYILGINSQWNRIGFYDRNKDHKDENRQWCLNPTFQLLCPLNKDKGHALKIAYKHTMDNIPYDAINTELRHYNANSYVIGNPFLTSSKSDLAMAVLSLYRGMFRFTGYYDRATDVIKYATYQDSGGSDVFYTMPVNCKLIESWGFAVEANVAPLSFWKMKAAAMVRLMNENAVIGGLGFYGTNQRYNLGINNDFTLGRNFGGNVCIDIEPAFRSLDRKYHTALNLQLGLYKMLFNNRLNLALNINIFNQTRNFDTEASVFNLSHKDVTHGQRAKISAIWKIGR